MNLFFLLTSLIFFSVSPFSYEEKSDYLEKNFEQLMCPDFSLLMSKHLQKLPFGIMTETKKFYEELKNQYHLKKFRQLNFENNLLETIPKQIHMIWLGPKPFPAESYENIRLWIHMNPEFKFNLWTDRLREIPIDGVNQIILSSENFSQLYEQFTKSNNYAEKSDILRYEILYNYGGIYTDHDEDCRRSIEVLCENYDFFASLSELDAFSRWRHSYVTNYNCALLLANGIIGSKKAHPIIKEVIEIVDRKWHKVSDYCFNSIKSPLELVILRSFLPFSLAVKNKLAACPDSIILPAQYFGVYFPQKEHNDNAIFGRQFFKSTWTDFK